MSGLKRDRISDDVQKPTKVLYPRNPDLDPQLVWRGKDEQDASDLEVPSVPIYIQEKIHPHAIIEDFNTCAIALSPPMTCYLGRVQWSYKSAMRTFT